MNVLILNDAGFGLEGGEGIYGKEMYCEIIARINEEIGNNVLRVTLGTSPSKSPETITIEGSRTPVLKTFIDKGITQPLSEICRENSVELIHANILNSHYPFLISKLREKLDIPIVATLHSWAYLCPTTFNLMLPEQIPCKFSSINPRCVKCISSKSRLSREKSLTNLPKMLHQTYALGGLLKIADSVISPSRELADILSKRLGKKVNYLPNPVITSFEDDNGTEEGSVLYMGRLEYEKGVHLLLQIATILENVPINIIGKGSLSGIFENNTPPNIHYKGFVSEREKTKLLRNASVVAIPSIWYEMFGYTVAEAFGMGKPVVAFDIGGPKDQIESSRGGLLAEPFNIESFSKKIGYLVDNKDVARKLGENGRKWVKENLHPSKYMKKINQVYENTLEGQ